MIWRCVFTFLVGVVLTQHAVKFSRRIGAIDIPRDWRRMHRVSTPRAGGVAILLALLIGAGIQGLADRASGALLFGALVVFAVGLWDDVRSLSPLAKLAAELIGSLGTVLISGERDLFRGVLSCLWLLLLTNAHNMIDGLDGLLAGCGTMEAVALGALLMLAGRGEHAALAWLLAAALLGFRVFNRAPACIFAGDCGAGCVGFLLGGLSLPLLLSASTPPEILSPLLLFAYPLTDLFAAVLRRSLRGRSPFAADRGHLHHRLCDTGLSRIASTRVLLLLTGGFSTLGVLVTLSGAYAAAAMLSLALAGFLFGVRERVLHQ